METQVTLRCFRSGSRYFASDGKREMDFASFGQAFKYASTLVENTSHLTIYNEAGEISAETWIEPMEKLLVNR